MVKESRVMINAIKCSLCGDIIYSRAAHDMKWCSCGNAAIDGGLYHTIISVSDPNSIVSMNIEIAATKEELYQDWRQQKNCFGLISK